MSDLDKKLTDTLIGVFNAGFKAGAGTLPADAGETVGCKTAIKRIKQAFIDAGWQQWIGPDSITSTGIDQTDTEIEYDKPSNEKFGKPVPFMSGQEWYDRFYNELHDGEKHIDDTKSYYIDHVLSVAKKAAGL